MSKIEKYLVEKTPKFGGGYQSDKDKAVAGKNDEKNTKEAIKFVNNAIGKVQLLVRSKILDKSHMTSLKKLEADLKKI